MSAIAPMPPPDPELQRTIDYIAHFVAKNGPASEEATRQQNFGNPNFSFLYGGEFSDYYKFRLLFEIQNLQKTIERTERRRSRFDQQPPAPPNKIPSLFETTIPPTLPPIKMQQPPPPSSTLQDQQQFPPAYSNANPNLQSLKDVDLTPKAPYYELPAGMMIPLIKLEDITYKPLKEQDLRLPTHEPTNNELIRELDRFYSALQLPPPVDCIRDADGWEFNGLTDHYVKKSEQRMKLETKMKEQGKTIEDAFINKFISHKESTNGDRGKAAEHTPRPRRKNSSASSSRSSSSSSSTSESSSTSKSSSQKSRSPSPIKRRRVSRSPTPEQRPTFSAGQPASAPRTSISFKVPPNPLDRETNKGAQILAKMGWEGRGLGSKEQGINEPVEGGEVRYKTEQYRGLGSKPDIYDEYRKQMSTQMAKRIHKF